MLNQILTFQSTGKNESKKRFIPFPLLASLTIQSNILHLKPSYRMYPSPQEIAHNNYITPQLTIANEHSSITWKGAIDLRSMKDYCLSDIVELGKDHVEVYPGASPKVGVELNQSCIATFFQAVDMQKCKISYQKLIKLLQKKTQEMRVKLISFDPSTGQLKIGIDHFSKYELELNLTSDEAEQENVRQAIEVTWRGSGSIESQYARPINNTSFFRRLNQSPPSQTTGINKQNSSHSMKIVRSEQLKSEEEINHEKINFKVMKDDEIKQPGSFKKQTQNFYDGFKTRLLNNPQIFQVGANFQRVQKKENTQFFDVSRHVKFANPRRKSAKNQSIKLIQLLLKADQNNLFQIIHHIICDNRYSYSLKQHFLLINILFNPSNKFVLYNNGNIIETQTTQPIQQSLKDWLQVRMRRETIKTTFPNLQLLVQRKSSWLIQKYQRQGRQDLAQIVSKLEDKVFLTVFKSHQDMPKQIMIILDQIFLDCLKEQSWVTKLTTNVFYSKNVQLKEVINQVLRQTTQVSSDQILLFKLLKIFVGEDISNIKYNLTDATVSQQELILQWWISNTLEDNEDTQTKNRQYLQTRHRLLHYLLTLPSDNSIKIQIVNFDTSLSKDQKAKLLKRTKITFEDKVEDVGNLEEVFVKAAKLKKQNKPFEALKTLCSSPFTQTLKSTEKELKRNIWFILSQEREIKKEFISLIEPFLDRNRTFQLCKVYLEIELGIRFIDIETMYQICEFARLSPPSLLNKIIKLVIDTVLANVWLYGKVFKEKQSKYIQIYSYLLNTVKDEKVLRRLKALSLPQL